MKKIILTFFLITFYSSISYGANLMQIYEVALGTDPMLNSAVYKRLAIKGDKQDACGQLFPQVVVRSYYVDYDQDESGSVIGESSVNVSGAVSGNQSSVGVTVNQSLFDLPKFNNCKKWRKLLDHEEISYKIIEQDLIKRVVSSYLSVLGARSNKKFAKGEVKLLTSLEAEIKNAFAAKTVPIRKVDAVKARLEAAKAKEVRAENSFTVAKSNLDGIYGKQIQMEDLFVLKDKMELALPAPNDADYWVDLAKQANLNIIQSELLSKAMKYNSDSEFSKHFPIVDVFAARNDYENDLERTSAAISSDQGHFSSEAIGIKLKWNLFAGGSNMGRANAAKNRYLSAREDYDSIMRNVMLNTKSNYLNLEALMAEIKAYKLLLVAARSELDSVEAGKKSKVKTKTDILEAKLELLSAKAAYDKSRFDYILAMIDFWGSIGTISKDNINELNLLFTESPDKEMLFSKNKTAVN